MEQIKSICELKNLPGVQKATMSYAYFLYNPRSGEYIRDLGNYDSGPAGKYSKVYNLSFEFSPDLDDVTYNNYKNFITACYKSLEENQRMQLNISEIRNKGALKEEYKGKYQKLMDDIKIFKDGVYKVLDTLPITIDHMEFNYPDELQIKKVVTDDWYDQGPWCRQIMLMVHQTSSVYTECRTLEVYIPRGPLGPLGLPGIHRPDTQNTQNTTVASTPIPDSPVVQETTNLTSNQSSGGMFSFFSGWI